VTAKQVLLWLAILSGAPVQMAAQTSPVPPGRGAPPPVPRTGEDVYRAACATCHGPDGRGAAKSVVGFDAPLPDFSDCAFSTAEPDPDWAAVVHEGGPIRGLDRHMPAFGEALSPEAIALAVNHLRTFCKEPAWPRGDLNLPRAFFTEKAFPENESVWATTFTRGDEGSLGNALIYEHRLGARNQIEVSVPITFQHDAGVKWNRGLGDVAVAFKRTLYASLRTGGIGAAGIEVILPTGKEQLGLGNGYTVFEPFAMWGQILPRNSFLQLHGGLEIPSDSAKGDREAYLRTAFGTTFAENRGFGRAWSPQVEVLWARPQGGPAEWDVVPQVQVTLSKLQHVMVAGGIRLPVTQRADRPRQGLVYLLWDWFDGGFFEFWK
jgi:mono/diheme cytochrome c family protein